MMKFIDRYDAGQKLAKRLATLHLKNPIIVALPRGGVPVGYEIARLLKAPLDVIIARKLGLPTQPEFGIGAIAEGNVKVLDTKTIASLGLDRETIEHIVQKEQEELERRVKLYRNNQKLPSLRGKTVILVDDGLATGITAKAAVQAITKLHPKKLIFAVPVCPRDTINELNADIDNVYCLVMPFAFRAVGSWYEHFAQTSDDLVIELLERARHLLPEAKQETSKQRVRPYFHQ